MNKFEFYICKECGNLQVIQKGETPLECCLKNPKKLIPRLFKEDFLEIEEKKNNLLVHSNYMNTEEKCINCLCFVNDNNFVIDYYFPYEEVNLEIPNEKGILYIQINKELYKLEIENAK